MRTPCARFDELLAASLGPVEKHLSGIHTRIREAQATMAKARQSITEIHTSHAGELAKLTALNQAASEQARERASLEQQVAKLEALEQQRAELNAELKTLLERRKSLKTDHISDARSDFDNARRGRVRAPIRSRRASAHSRDAQRRPPGIPADA